MRVSRRILFAPRLDSILTSRLFKKKKTADLCEHTLRQVGTPYDASFEHYVGTKQCSGAFFFFKHDGPRVSALRVLS